MPAHSKLYILPLVWIILFSWEWIDYFPGKGVVRGCRGQQLGFAFCVHRGALTPAAAPLPLYITPSMDFLLWERGSTGAQGAAAGIYCADRRKGPCTSQLLPPAPMAHLHVTEPEGLNHSEEGDGNLHTNLTE